MEFSTNPYPYIYAAYIFSSLLVFGYAFLIYKENRRLIRYLDNIDKEN